MLLSGQEYVDMYATSMKDRILAAAKTKAREIQEAALPGAAAKELEEALAAGEESSSRAASRAVDDAAADIDERTASDDRTEADPAGDDERPDGESGSGSVDRAAS
jgi:1-acyl-sn-glycerol-3-phosphate acyltransferase